MVKRFTPVMWVLLATCARPVPPPQAATCARSAATRRREPPACIEPYATRLLDPCASVRDGGELLEHRAAVDLLAQAEAAFAANDWPSCAELQSRLAAGHADARAREEAAYAAVLCLSNELAHASRDGGEGRRGPSYRPQERRPLTEREAAFDQAGARYACIARDGDEVAAVHYRRARVRYDAYRWDEAAVLFGYLVRRYPEHELATYAAMLYLDSLHLLAQLDQNRGDACLALLGSEVDRFLDVPELTADEQLEDMLCALDRRRAETLGRQGRHREAARAYLEHYLSRADACGEAGSVLQTAARHLELAGREEQAAEVRRRELELVP